MKTQKSLARKSLISCTYLLVSLTLVTLVLAPSPVLNKFHYNVENGVGLMLLAAAILYFAHFVFGTFYYPYKYGNIIKTFAYDDCGTDTNVWDLSYARAILSMFIIPVAFSRAGYTAGVYPIFYLVWLLINLFLLVKTRTDNLFIRDSLTIDAPLLMSWKKTDNSGHLYETIQFLRPVLEDAELWRQKIVKAYIGAEAKYFATKTLVEMKDLQQKQSATEETIKLARALKIPRPE